MHNCKLTRSSFIDLVLAELPPARLTDLLTELDNCPTCQEEYAALRSTLHVSNQALRSVLPGEEFWPGYRDRLHTKLLASPTPEMEHYSLYTRPARLPLSAQLWLALRTMATTSVRVPVPAALALMLLFGVSFFVLRARAQVNAAPPSPEALVETKTVPVPVIQEKVVTHVVYLEKKGRRSGSGANRLDRTDIPSNGVAATGSDASARTALSLVGFKPTDEVKLTVIKGSYKDQKR